MKKAGLVLTAALLLTTACGGNSGSSRTLTDQEKTVIASMVAAISTPTGMLQSDDAECVATAFVTAVGVKRLQSAKAVGADNQYAADGALVDAATSAAYTRALLSCVKEADVLSKVEASSEAGYGADAQGFLNADQVHCLIPRFVEATGVAKLFSARFVTDSGAFNGSGSAYDDATATHFADALVGCVDYPRLQAKAAVAQNKKLSLSKLAACLTRKVSEAEVKAIIVARLTGAPNAEGLLAANKAKSDACEKVSRK